MGRAARQGRSGAAFSLLESEELPWMVDLHLFLGRKLENVVEPGGYKVRHHATRLVGLEMVLMFLCAVAT